MPVFFSQGVNAMDGLSEEMNANSNSHRHNKSNTEDIIRQALQHAENLLLDNKVEEALGVYKEILEADKDNILAQEGFRHAYAKLLESEGNESEAVDNSTRIACLFRELKILEAYMLVLKRRKKH